MKEGMLRTVKIVLLPLRAAAALLERLAVSALVFLCRIWQILGSPLVGERCRFYPTCSQYAVMSLKEHGLIRGCLLAGFRLSRCHPLGKGGHDPVPPRKQKVSHYETSAGRGH